MEKRQLTGRKWQLLLAAGLLVPTLAAGKTLRTITIDGDLNDWAGTLLDDDQTVADRSLAQADPDLPSQAQRDARGFAFTWDSQNFYVYFSRTGSGTNSFNLVLYFDRNHDMLLSSADRVAFLKFSGSSFGGLDVHAYSDDGTPDPLTGDGVTPAGSQGAIVTTAGATAAVESTGIRIEAAIAWTSLGVAPGTPMFIHPGVSSNQNLPAGVVDNTDPLDTLLPAVEITAGLTRGAPPGGTVDVPHRVTNAGTADDVLDLQASALLGSRLEVWTDPDGDGDPADGRSMAVDANGDGDFSDPMDVRPQPADDANGDAFPDGGSLSAGAFRDFVLRLRLSPSHPIGADEIVRVLLVSSYRASVRQQVEDRVRVGYVTLVPSAQSGGAPGGDAWLAHEACNDSGSTRVLDVTAASAGGWPIGLWSDPDGDGDPSDGAPLGDTDGDLVPDLGSLADGECVSLVAIAAVPALATGSEAVDVTAADGALSDSQADTVEVAGTTVDFVPDRSARSQPGRTIFMPHRLLNAGATTEPFSLSATSSLGSGVTFLDDPNGDEEPSDSQVVTSTPAVRRSGGQEPLLVRVRVAASAVDGQVDAIAATATGQVSGLAGSAADSITIHGLLTYSDPFFARPSTAFFGQCATVHALAFRSSGTYRFAWLDPGGAVARTSADLTPYSDGSLDDFLDLGGAPAQGTWTVKLQAKTGSSYTDVGPSALSTFEVIDLVSRGAAIERADTGADIYAMTGDDFVGFTEVANPTTADVLASSFEYVVFQDLDADGQPTANEPYLRADGTSAAWGPGLVTTLATGVDVFSGETYGDRRVVASASYVTSGVWTMQVTWRASCGYLLATDAASFTVGCQPPPTFAGLVRASDRDPCLADGVVLDWDPATDWGLGTSGTYAVYRSEDPAFTPDAATLLVAGLTATSYLDASAAVGVTYTYVVRAESDVTCSSGPNNGGLEDGNAVRRRAADDVTGQAPVAAFINSAPNCETPGGTSVDFADVSSGPPAQWSWDFDDDGSVDATTPSASFTYPAPGTYTARLTVANSCGSSSTTATVVVSEAPLALAQANRTETCVGEPVDFDGSASSAASGVASAAWDFDGDGTDDATGLFPAPFAYPGAGSFVARLTVVDGAGCTDVDDVPVEVFDALSVTLAPPVVDHCTGDVAVTATPSGGRGPYDVTWDGLVDDGAGTGRATLPLGGSTTVTALVTDAAGCTTQASVVVTVNDRLGIALTRPVVDQCTGLTTAAATAAGGAGPYTFAFDVLADDGTGLGSGTLAPGTHVVTVTVTDAAGCSASVQSKPFDVAAPVSVSFASQVDYVYPDVFAASLAASASGGTAPFSFSWDVGADGSVDATGVSAGFGMGANEVVPVVVTVTDGNGCAASFRADVASGGCPATDELRMLRVRKQGGGLAFDWEPSAHSCHGRYGLLEADTARPAAGAGSFPDDPAWRDIRLEDADGSDLDASFALADPRAGRTLYVLVRDGGTDGSWGPTGHYGNTGVLP